MSIIKHSQLLQSALNFLTEAHQKHPKTSIIELIDEASMRFNLTPLDAVHLTEIFSPQLEHHKDNSVNTHKI